MPRYFTSLDHEGKKWHIEKLKVDGEDLPDPHGTPDDLWQDGITKWPSLEFGDLVIYLVDIRGSYTKEKLKAYRSLETYNYLTTVMCVQFSIMKFSYKQALYTIM